METNNWNSLIDFLKELGVIEGVELSKNTTLEKDLGIRGDDIEEFFYKYSKKFNVDLSSFKPERYFEADLFTELILMIKGRSEKKHLTLADLEAAIGSGKLE